MCKSRFPASAAAKSGQKRTLNNLNMKNTDSHAKQKNENFSGLTNSGYRNALFQTAKVEAVHLKTGQKTVVRIALDTLSNRTYITDAAIRKLGLRAEAVEDVYVSVFGGQNDLEVKTKLVSFGIVENDGNVREIEANTMPLITKSSVMPRITTEAERKLIDTFKKTGSLADDPDDSDGTIDILLGQTYTWEFIIGTKVPVSEKIYLIPTTVGFMLGGELSSEPDYHKWGAEPTFLCLTETHATQPFPDSLAYVASESKLQPDYPDVSQFWDLETIGIKDDAIIHDDDIAQMHFDRTVYKQDGRYFVSLPWIEEKKPLLAVNYDTSLRRFRSLHGRLQKDDQLLKAYQDTIQFQLQEGIIEKVPPGTTVNPVHYIPHHPVVKESSATTKVRIVYDASSRSSKHEKSLNECLNRGPVILPDLCQCLIRFRTHKTAIIADIQKAFLQIAIQPDDRDVTRFLWYDDPEKPSLSNLATYRFCRVPFGVISSPFLLGATITHHLKTENTSFASGLLENVYVDNVITGLDGDDNPVQFYKNAKDVFARAGMNLQEFASNSPKLMQFLPEEDKFKNPVVKVLGLT